MTTKRDPAFLFYATAWLQSERVSGMSLEQQGAYVRLLCLAWLHGSIPGDPGWIRQTLGWSPKKFAAEWPAIAPCWSPAPDDPSRLVSQRMEEEREQRRLKSEEMRRRGAAGAAVTNLRQVQ